MISLTFINTIQYLDDVKNNLPGGTKNSYLHFLLSGIGMGADNVAPLLSR